MAVGRVVLVAGILILLFIPYLLWGTGLQTARSQDQLRQEFHADQRATGGTSAHSGGSTPVPTSPPKLAPAAPTPSVGTAVGVIDIPKISLSMVVVQGTGVDQLQQGPGHYANTPLPGQNGNVAIAGHRTTYLHPFYNLNELTPGDPVVITTTQGEFIYHVTSSQSVSPSDVSVVGASTTPELTLTTCTPRFSASQRLVVHAVLVASLLASDRHATPVVPKHPTTVDPPAAVSRSWPVAIAWGAAVALLITGIWVLARRTRSWPRAVVLGGGLVAWLVVVFFFYQSLAPLLPASY
jgi:sortase A